MNFHIWFYNIIKIKDLCQLCYFPCFILYPKMLVNVICFRITLAPIASLVNIRTSLLVILSIEHVL